MKGKKLVALLAAGAMVFSPAGMALGTPLEGVFASAVSAADAVDYLYYDEASETYKTGTVSEYTSVTAGDYEWETGIYVLDTNVTYGTEETSRRVAVKGDVKLILKDGCTLTANGGIQVSEGNSLTIYAQSENEETMGQLNAISMFKNNAGIGGNDEENCGTITIHGGIITAKSSVEPDDSCISNGAGIGGGNQGDGGIITINGGIINATGGLVWKGAPGISGSGAAIGGGAEADGGNITINGGTIYPEYSEGAGIGGGRSAKAGTIKINAGNIKILDVKTNTLGAGIGGGSSSDGGFITINNGNITINGSSNGTGIGSGHTGKIDDIVINGGNLDIQMSTSSPCIGRTSGSSPYCQIEINGGTILAHNTRGIGIGGSGTTIAVTNGTIEATGGNGGAGIGGSSGSSLTSYPVVDINISGGDIEAIAENGGAAIGGNVRSDTGTIVVSGGTVQATATSDNITNGAGAGIGSGYQGDGGNVIITGGNVTAIGGDGDQNVRPSSGIGPGAGGTGGNVIITGGVVTATGGGKGDGSYNQAPAIGSYDGTSGTFSTVLPENGISTLGLLDDASSSRSGNAVVFANGYGSIDSPISDLSQQDSWGGLFFLNGEGMMLGQTVKPTDSFILPEGYSFTINQLQTLDMSNAVMYMLDNCVINNNGKIINPDNKHIITLDTDGNKEDNGEVVNPDPENPPADLTGLSALIEEAKAAIASGQYTEDSLKELEILIETVESAETLTDEQVKTYISQIQNAMDALKKPVDTSGVDQVISAFESRTDLDQYTDESVKAVNDLIAEYQSKTGLTQDEIDEYLSKIQSAIDGLRYEIDTTAIDREIKKFNEMTLTNYTAESVKAVRDVIDEYTRAIATGENLSQNDVDQYLARIQEKVAALEWTSGEHYGGVYDKIRELIQQAYDMLNSGTHYLEDAITEVNNAIQHAQQVLKIPDLSYRSEEAEDAIFSLEDAIDYLKNNVDNYYGLDMSAYTNLVRQDEQLEELGYHGPAYNDLWRMINNLPTHFADQAAVDAYVAQMDALLQQAIEENTTVPGGDISDSVLVQSMIDYFQRIAASGDYTEASIHRVQALINSIPDTLTDEQARYYADLIYDAVMAMEPKGSSDPVYIEVPVSSGSSSTGSSSASSTQTGWVHNTNGSVYYKNGKVLTGWQTIDGDRYYFSKQGFMQTGWQVIDGSYYYFSANGVMLTGWQKYDTAWYYLDPDTGKMVADGLYEIDGKSYYFYDWGGMAYNFWYQTESGWYFFGGDGAMKKAGWIQWDGNYYYLTASGRMAVNTTTPDGYYVNANGIWNG